MNKQNNNTLKKILSITNPIKRYETLHLFINSVFVDSLNGLNLSSLLNIDEIDISNAEDILTHLLKIKKDLVDYSKQLRVLNERIKKQQTINAILSLVVSNSSNEEKQTLETLDVEEIDEMIKRLDSLNVEVISESMKQTNKQSVRL